MMFSNKFVVVIKVNGKVLREVDDTVYIPFNSEYSILLKNLNTVNAVATVHVDGMTATDEQLIIVPANSCVELEGFIKDSRVTNKFKFIEKTPQVESFRGNKLEDGLVKVTYQFEQQRNIFYPETLWYGVHYPVYDNTTIIGRDTQLHCGAQQYTYSNTTPLENTASNIKVINTNDDGITVKGSQSGQEFREGSVGLLETNKHVIVLQIKGETKHKKIKKAINVKTKIECPVCGKKCTTKNSFCSRCGSALVEF